MNSKIFIFALLISSQSFASSMSKAFSLFKVGNYVETLSVLSKVKGNNKLLGAKFYLKAVTLNKLQRYDEAIQSFQSSLSIGYTSKDIFYEYGQALYAKNDLQKARKVFSRSAKNNYKRSTSYYYIAHISQILEDWKLAKSYYLKIVNSKKVEVSIMQVAHFQLGEVLLSIAELNKTSSRDLVNKYVLPQFEKAAETDKFSLLSKEILQRKLEVQKRYDLDPNLYKNGERIPPKNFVFGYTQGFSYDNNITYSTDAPTSTATQKDSNIFSSNVSSSYTFTLGRRWTFTPAFGLTYLYHQDRDASEVFQNDQLSYAPAIRSKIKHKMFGKPASLILSWDYSYINQDRDAIKVLDFYSRSYTLTLGEKLKLFSKEDSTFKIKYKDLASYSDSLNSSTKTFALDHLILMPSYSMFFLLFSYDIYDSKTDSLDQTTFLSRIDYIIPSIADQYLLDIALSITIGNKEVAQTSSILISPSVMLTKMITQKSSLQLGYTYTNNLSDVTSDKYTKHVTAIDYKFNF
ncbi:MAG: autotransporter domain-containing protein [Bacteriovoracaceae bacterium]|jgi:tetratricopeptide (TPR) repeat protein|nr:autotransporter domain-containing protein [Bacteriovoracaceae bacterium]